MHWEDYFDADVRGPARTKMSAFGAKDFVASGSHIRWDVYDFCCFLYRGCAEDYDAWGVPGWTAKEALKWFTEVEDNSRGKSKFHGTGGLMSVEDPRYQNSLFDLYFR